MNQPQKLTTVIQYHTTTNICLSTKTYCFKCYRFTTISTPVTIIFRYCTYTRIVTYLTLKNRGSVMNRYEHCRTGENVECSHVSRRNSIPVLLRASEVGKFYPTTSTTRI